MNNAQDAVTTAQAQALEAIRSGQSAALEAVRAWGQAVSKFSPEMSSFMPMPMPGMKETVGDPAAIVDSVYDFAAQLMELNKQFVHSLLAASTQAAGVVEDAANQAASSAAKATSTAKKS